MVEEFKETLDYESDTKGFYRQGKESIYREDKSRKAKRGTRQ
jgi:hypothetical protein